MSYFAITVAIILAYLPSLNGGFLLDDNLLIKDNPAFIRPTGWETFVVHEDGIVRGSAWDENHTGYYRPLVAFSFRLDYLLWGMNPQGFRFTNIILHIAICFTLFQVLLLFHMPIAAFWATCLFALHPIQTETVSWISSRNNLLTTFFALLSFYSFARFSVDKTRLKFLASLIFFALAVFSKEFGLMLLPCLIFFQRCYFSERVGVSYELFRFLPFFGIALGYLFLRKTVTGVWTTPSGWDNFFLRLQYVPYLITWNLRLICFPANLHSFIVDYPRHLFSLQAAVSTLFLGSTLGLLWKTRREKIFGFAAVSFLVSLAPILNIVKTSAVSLVSMRWLYFPMIFISFLIAWMIQRSIESRVVLTNAALVCVAIYMGSYSYLLNKNLWVNEDAFFAYEVGRFDNAFYYGGFAENLLSRKVYGEAEKYFTLSIEAFPRDSKNYINYSALLLETGRPSEALKLLEKARDLSMEKKCRVEWYNNLGTSYFRLKNYDQALWYLKQAAAISPDAPYVWSNMGVGFLETGDYPSSIEAFKRALEAAPDSIEIKKKMAIAYLHMDRPEDGLSVLEKIPAHQWSVHGIDAISEEAQKTIDSRHVSPRYHHDDSARMSGRPELR